MTDTDPAPFRLRLKASEWGSMSPPVVIPSSPSRLQHQKGKSQQIGIPKQCRRRHWMLGGVHTASSASVKDCPEGLGISNILGEILVDWSLMLIEIAVQILLIFISGVVCQATGIGGREWGALFASALGPMPLGVCVRLLLDIGNLLTKLSLLYNPDFPPTDESQTTRLGPEEERPVSPLSAPPTPPTTTHGVYVPTNFELDYSNHNQRFHQISGDLLSADTVYAEVLRVFLAAWF
ncbi:hypothetical protein B0H16DRAFT_1451001 [Mycena metata]|uniref:Uncharacterized protein n=1 Tax=Mycena metata TaxID=1033252 RepID=A0AAD7JYG7_9AGAR|nr:hypothetical protein B0H16DRAFT_1451001 [Mycena metata]